MKKIMDSPWWNWTIWLVVVNGIFTLYLIFVDETVITDGVDPVWGRFAMVLCSLGIYFYETDRKRKKQDETINYE